MSSANPTRRRRATGLVADLAPPALLTVAAAHELSYNHSGPLTWVLAMALIWPLAWRRRAPLAIFAACLAVGVVIWLRGTPTVAAIALLVALYSVAAHRDQRRALAAAVVLEAGVVLVAARFAPSGSVDDALLFLTGLVAAALFLGTTLRANRRYLASAEDRARRLEREREQDARLAAAAERTRIAREMHDIVAHGLSVVISLAEGAAANTETDPRGAQEAMQQVAVAGRQSLAEMRRLLEVLRTDGAADRDPQPSLATLDALVEDVRQTGLAVEVHRSGDPGAMGQTEQATLYRIVQEALTNVLKHAHQASRVTLTLDHQPSITRFAVEDDGRPAPPDANGDAGGNGLLGMRERIAVFGGSLDTGPSPTGWLVRGELPLR